MRHTKSIVFAALALGLGWLFGSSHTRPAEAGPTWIGSTIVTNSADGNSLYFWTVNNGRPTRAEWYGFHQAGERYALSHETADLPPGK